MSRLALFASVLALAACSVGSDSRPPGTGDDTGGGGDDGSGSDTGNNISGHITSDVTWSGASAIVGDTTIDAGVTVTMMPGTTLTIVTAAKVVVNGTLDVAGTAASKVHIGPATTLGGHFDNIAVTTGAQLTMTFGVQEGGGIETTGSGKVTITDSQLDKSGSDWLVMNGGTIDVEYSNIGLDEGLTDTTHCDLHIGGGGNTIKFEHNNVSTSQYGIMFYGGTSEDFQHDNWFANTHDIDTEPGVQGDFSGGWFEAGTPTAGAGAQLTLDTLSDTKLDDCGPRG
ncbi:MAG TPA: hypothetical protein VGM88_29290 [Kofleriaceae bacterium]|jgi:hypothetical protein